ncbi:MAG: hypothetical protein FGM14_16165 [Flavobacteriales bacterium]|nr:hypothetical protein [Flavobacteriales bacterium]
MSLKITSLPTQTTPYRPNSPPSVGITNSSDYSPFGVQLDGRTISKDQYRYGFQNQEKDDELKGAGNSVNYKYRMHDPRVGRFFAVDPLADKYPYYSPYSFSGNRVIDYVESKGCEPSDPDPNWWNTFYGLVFGGINMAIAEVIDSDNVEEWINGTYGQNLNVRLINGVSTTIGATIGAAFGNVPGLFIGAGVGYGFSLLTQKIIGISVNVIANKRIRKNKEEWNSLNEELRENNTIINKNQDEINNTLKEMKGTINENIESEEGQLKYSKERYEYYKKRDEEHGPGIEFLQEQMSNYSKKIIEKETKITKLKNISNLENQNIFLSTRNKQINEIKNSIINDKNYKSEKK